MTDASISPDLRAQARQYAALSGPFDPTTLGDVLGQVTTKEAMAVMADLADACDTGAAEGRWLMRGSVRQRELDQLSTAAQLDAAVGWRRRFALDQPTEDLLDALTGAGDLAAAAVQDAVQSDVDRVDLDRIAVALDRAGERAPAQEALEAVRSALGRLDAQQRSASVLGGGFFGREDELEQIVAWIAEPATERPVPVLFISGLPGTGKSTLVEKAAAEATAAERPSAVVRLDFDRGGLDVLDRVGLTIEVSRQAAIALGEHAAALTQARLAAAGATSNASPDVKGESREHVPYELSGMLGEAMQRSGRPLLVILDTMEVLRGRGETHPRRLFDCLDELCDRGVAPMAVVAAGRGDAIIDAGFREVERIELAGLPDEAADRLLAAREIDPALFANIREVAGGNPLVLRLAARAVCDAGPQALDTVKGRREVAAAYLYRFLLSRIDDPTLRTLAQPGLVVRRINADVIAEVLAPKLKLGRLDPNRATEIYEKLKTHHWLVEEDGPSWVRHRPDIRALLLELLYRKSPARAAAIDRAAAKWFAARLEPFAPIEAAYHELQSMRRGSAVPHLDPAVLAQLDNDTIAELPDVAQDLVRASRGERTTKFRGFEAEVMPPADLAQASSQLDALLERGDVVEAAYVHKRTFAQQAVPRQGPEAAVELAFLWRAGRWGEAFALARRLKYMTLDGDAGAWSDLSPVVQLAQLEIWAELNFRTLVEAILASGRLAEVAVNARAGGIKGSLANGALGFALLSAGMAGTESSWNLENPVETARSLWGGNVPSPFLGRTGRESATEALALPANRFQALVSPFPGEVQGPRRVPKPRLPDPATPVGAARLLATSTPYGAPAEALRRAEKRTRILDHLSTVDFDLAESGGLPPVGAGGWSIAPAVSPEGSVDNLAALGLLAEWLGAAAFVLRHADLRKIALAAERWRRTVAGDWAYKESPAETEGWDLRPDPTIDDRLRQLLAADDPVATGRKQLLLWAAYRSKHGDDEVVRRIRDRVPAAITAARRAAGRKGGLEEGARAAAVRLQQDLPSAFVPAMAVLTVTE